MADDHRRGGAHKRSGPSGKTYDALTRQLLDEELVILNEPGGHRIRRAASGPYPGVARSGPAPVPAI